MSRQLGSVASVALLLVGCSSDENPSKGSKTDEIVIGVSPFQDTIMPKFAAVKGWYKEEGLNVRFVTLGWTEINEALSAPKTKRVDIAINNECGVISAQPHNKQIVYYYGLNPFDNGFALMIRPNGELRPLDSFLKDQPRRGEAVKAAAAQLRGRTVITTSNTDMEQGVAAAARLAGLSLGTDVRIINLPPEEGLAAFLSGQGDAYIGGVPQRLAARRRGAIEMLTGVDLGPPPVNGYVTTKEFVEERPEVLPKLLKVWFRTVSYTNNHREEVAQAISSMLKKESGVDLSPADFVQNWNRTETFFASPVEAQAQMLDGSGRNFWRKRWDDCNHYYVNVAHTAQKPVDPNGVFLMAAVQPKVMAAYTTR